MKCQQQRIVSNEAVEVIVLGHVALNHTQSTRQLAEALVISRSFIIRILKTHKIHPYKTKLVQYLHRDYRDRRLQFGEEMTQRTYYLIWFSD